MNKLQELYNYSVATYRSSIEIVDNIFDAEITRFYPTTSNTIHFDAKI